MRRSHPQCSRSAVSRMEDRFHRPRVTGSQTIGANAKRVNDAGRVLQASWLIGLKKSWPIRQSSAKSRSVGRLLLRLHHSGGRDALFRLRFGKSFRFEVL